MIAGLPKLLRHSAVYLVAAGFQRGLPLVLLPLVASDLTLSSLGAIALGVLLAGAVSLVSLFGLNVAVVRYKAKDSAASEGLWSSLFAVQVAWSAVVGLAFLLVTSVWVPWDSVDGGRALAYGSIALGLAQGWLQMAMASYRARQSAGGFLTMAVVVFGISLPVAMMLTASHGAAGYVWGLSIGASIPAIVGITVSVVRPLFDRGFLFVALSLAAPFMVHWAATWVLVGFDRFLIETHLGLASTGVFYLAFVYASVPLLIAESFGTAWLPAFLAADVETDDIGKVVVGVSLGVASIVLLGLAAAIFVMPALYGDLDDRVLPLLAVLAPIAVIRVPHIVGNAPLIRSHRTPILSYSSMSAAVFDIAVVLLLIDTAGLEGVAWAKVAAFVVASIWVWVAVTPKVSWSAGIGAIFVGFLMSVISYGLMSTVDSGLTPLSVATAFAAAGLVAIVIALRMFAVHSESSDKEAEGAG